MRCDEPRDSEPGNLLANTLTSTNLVVMLVMMQVGKKIPFEDPNVLMGIRGLYLLSNLLILAVNMYIIQQVNKKKGMLH